MLSPSELMAKADRDAAFARAYDEMFAQAAPGQPIPPDMEPEEPKEEEKPT